MLDDFAVLRSGYLRLLLLPNRRLTRARGTVYCPCQEIPRQPFEPFGTSSLIFHPSYHLDLIILVPSLVIEKETFLPSCSRATSISETGNVDANGYEWIVHSDGANWYRLANSNGEWTKYES